MVDESETVGVTPARMSQIIETISVITPREMRKLKDSDLFRYAAKYNEKATIRRVAVEELAKAGRTEVLEYVAATGRYRETRFRAIGKLAGMKRPESLRKIIEHCAVNGTNMETAVRCADSLYRMVDALVEEKDLAALAWVSKYATSHKARENSSKWMDRIRRVVKLKRFDSGYA